MGKPHCSPVFRFAKSGKVYMYNFSTFASSFLPDSRETAFVYAITAAGVVFSITKACSKGALLQCACDNNILDNASDGEWEWGGCHDDVQFGYVKTKQFVDDRRKRRRGDLTTKIQLHNNEAGRLVRCLFLFVLNPVPMF